MVLRRGWLAALGVAALAWSGLSAAQQYRADEFLGLDISRAALSPKPLGPATSFAPGPLGVTVGRGNDAPQASAEFLVEPKTVPAATVRAEGNSSTTRSATRSAPRTVASRTRVAHPRVERSASRAPRALVALHRRNPVEAQARDTALQLWPCKSGGICNWKR